jgi:hypothetical protein
MTTSTARTDQQLSPEQMHLKNRKLFIVVAIVSIDVCTKRGKLHIQRWRCIIHDNFRIAMCRSIFMARLAIGETDPEQHARQRLSTFVPLHIQRLILTFMSIAHLAALCPDSADCVLLT